MHFVVHGDGGATLAERTYDFDFLDGDKHEEIVVEVGSLRLRFEHWGESTCSNTPYAPPSDANEH